MNHHFIQAWLYMDSQDPLLLSHDDLADEVSRLRMVIKSLVASETARRRIKDQLIQERNVLHSLFDLNPHPTVWLDVQGRLLRANQAALACLHPAQPSTEPSSLADPQLAALGVREVFGKVLAGATLRMPRHRFNPSRSHPGAPDVDLFLETVLFPVENANGDVDSVVVMHMNVTELAKAESAVQQLRASLARKDAPRATHPRRSKRSGAAP